MHRGWLRNAKSPSRGLPNQARRRNSGRRAQSVPLSHTTKPMVAVTASAKAKAATPIAPQKKMSLYAMCPRASGIRDAVCTLFGFKMGRSHRDIRDS